MLYLLNMTVSGIKSIEKEVRLDFYKKTVTDKFNPEKYRIKAIYGENGSGKSAIITAVKIFQDLIINDNYLAETKNQIFLDEIINKKTQVFHFTCEFFVGLSEISKICRYSVEIGKADNGLYEIQFETLEAKNGTSSNTKYYPVFCCQNGELRFVDAADEQKELIEKKSLNLLTTHSFVCIFFAKLLQNINVSEMKEADSRLVFHMVLCFTLAITIKVYLAQEDQHELYFWRKRLKENSLKNMTLQEELYEHGEFSNIYFSVNEKMIDKNYFDAYREKVRQLADFIKIFKPNLVSIEIDAKENGEQYECELNLNYGEYSINKEFESTGIKKLISLFEAFVSSSEGGIVFIDEMDSNLNDIYLCKLIEYFMYYGKGQLCFTTHNLDPMSVLKKNKNSIDFLSSDNHLISWTSRGNATPENCYRNGMIEDSPFNIDATDFIGILGD